MAATIHDDAARATVRDEVWALTQLLWSHADLSAKVTSLEGQADGGPVGALRSAPTQTLDAAQNAIAHRIRRLEHYVQSMQAAEKAEQDAVEEEERQTVLQSSLRDQATQYGSEALDLLARANVGSLAPDLPAPPLNAETPKTARHPLDAFRKRADDLVECIQSLEADAPPDLVAAARHLSTWLKNSA
ncbi:hypothetical protein [Streptomyces sp. CL12-4]|uniref:hypothetical protein n=1 Tax=Streptomyces sp. CL12-4 TaxID=2810306 RepID=UPI001EFB8F3A|nr:hypothetical protein [Streptomyces sp. CL12-4]MCG8971396.1 hypothetical protein [Streptomyces sp. CL12-4]